MIYQIARYHFNRPWIFLLPLLLLICCASPPPETNTAMPEEKIDNPLIGGWNLVKGQYGGTLIKADDPFQFKVFSDQHFSFLMHTDSGGWNYSSAGRYEIKNGQYGEWCTFSTVPEYVGAYAAWNYYFQSDTLIFEGPVKMLDNNGEETEALRSIYGTMKEWRVRAD